MRRKQGVLHPGDPSQYDRSMLSPYCHPCFHNVYLYKTDMRKTSRINCFFPLFWYDFPRLTKEVNEEITLFDLYTEWEQKRIGRTEAVACKSLVYQGFLKIWGFIPYCSNSDVLITLRHCRMPPFWFVVTFSIVHSSFIFFIYQPDNRVFLTGISIRVLTKWLPSPLSQVTETTR